MAVKKLYPPIEEGIATYDWTKRAPEVAQAEQQRQEILSRFPRAEWPDLPLKRYALGTDETKETYCWWLEFGSVELGSIRGGSAAKHIIYKHKYGEWRYRPPDAYSDAQEAWEAIRAGFVQAFSLADEGRWEEIDSIAALVPGAAVRTKTLHVYFPDQILPVYSRQHLTHFLQLLGLPEGGADTSDVIRLNRVLRAQLMSRPDLSDRSPVEVMRFLYDWADPGEGDTIVKIAPGKDARYWDDCLTGGYICVGWDDVGDLLQYDSKEEFQTAFADNYGNMYAPKKLTKKLNELWTLRELSPGDRVVANKGIGHVLGVGEVTEPGYEWNLERPEYRHTVSVDWDTSMAGPITSQPDWAFVTVKKLPPELYAKIINGGRDGVKKPLPVPNLYHRMATALESKRQLVLYGPPGTGKTYHARRFAAWWLLRRAGDAGAPAVLSDSAALAEAERQFATSSAGGRAWWVVANPSEWSWDQLFKKGRVEYTYGRLKKNYALLQEGDLVVGYQAAPDLRIVALARITRTLHENEDGEKVIELEPVTRVKNGPTYSDLISEPVLKTSEPIRNRCQGTLFALTEDEWERLSTLLMQADPEMRDLLVDREVTGPLTRLTFHPSYSYEDFIEGFRPVDQGEGLILRLVDGVFKRVCQTALADPEQPYLVLIDEINRANLAKVFGELITLLEADKRGMTVSLPQSREPFQIPPNVYMVGTMNTADRSIRLLDAAIRRRFSFIELMPDPELFHGAQIEGLQLDEFLSGLNRRIAEREGREKQIGHSYLLQNGVPILDPNAFAQRFRGEIIPLLQEYCYDDFSVLAAYVGEALVDPKEQALNEEILHDPPALLAALADHFSGPIDQ